MSSETINIIFPIETMVRELDSRLFLSSLHIKNHHRIFLAHTPHANHLAAHLKGGGLYVGKHIFATGGAEPVAYYRAKENGFKVIHLAEEGAVFMGGPEDWKFDLDWQLRPKNLFKDDYLATWGNWQKEYYLSQGAPNPENVRVTGHPRFDIYKGRNIRIYEEHAEKYRSQYGDFFLINSNFSFAVNPLGHGDSFSQWQGYYPENEEDRIRFVERWSKQNQAFALFVELAHKLAAKYQKNNIVIRPHPSDDIDQIRAVFSGVKNVHVIREGSVVPWILASRVLIHEGCTTGLEAYLLKKPAISFLPVRSKQDGFLPNAVSCVVNNLDDVFDKVSEIMMSKNLESEIPELAHQLFANFKDDSIYKFQELIREAEEELTPSKRADMTAPMFNQFKHYLLENSKHILRKTLFERRYRWAVATRVLFPGFNKKLISDRINCIAGITGRLMKFRLYSPWLLELHV